MARHGLVKKLLLILLTVGLCTLFYLNFDTHGEDLVDAIRKTSSLNEALDFDEEIRDEHDHQHYIEDRNDWILKEIRVLVQKYQFGQVPEILPPLKISSSSIDKQTELPDEPPTVATVTRKVLDNPYKKRNGVSKNKNIERIPSISTPGVLNVHYWDGFCGSRIEDLKRNIHFPYYPSERSNISKFFIRRYETGFGQRIFGYLHPPETGNFTFAVSCDDNCEVWLSSSDSPNDVEKIAYVGTLKSPSNTKVADFQAFTSQISKQVHLDVSKKYYVEVLHKQGAYKDHVLLTWLAPSWQRIRSIQAKDLSSFISLNPDFVKDVNEYKRFIPTSRACLLDDYSEQNGSIYYFDRSKYNFTAYDPREEFFLTPAVNDADFDGLLPGIEYSPSYVLDFVPRRYEGVTLVHEGGVYPDDFSELTHMQHYESCYRSRNSDSHYKSLSGNDEGIDEYDSSFLMPYPSRNSRKYKTARGPKPTSIEDVLKRGKNKSATRKPVSEDTANRDNNNSVNLGLSRNSKHNGNSKDGIILRPNGESNSNNKQGAKRRLKRASHIAPESLKRQSSITGDDDDDKVRGVHLRTLLSVDDANSWKDKNAGPRGEARDKPISTNIEQNVNRNRQDFETRHRKNRKDYYRQKIKTTFPPRPALNDRDKRKLPDRRTAGSMEQREALPQSEAESSENSRWPEAYSDNISHHNNKLPFQNKGKGRSSNRRTDNRKMKHRLDTQKRNNRFGRSGGSYNHGNKKIKLYKTHVNFRDGEIFNVNSTIITQLKDKQLILHYYPLFGSAIYYLLHKYQRLFLWKYNIFLSKCKTDGNLRLNKEVALDIVDNYMKSVKKKHGEKYSLQKIINVEENHDVEKGDRYLIELELVMAGQDKPLRLSKYIYRGLRTNKLYEPSGFQWNPKSTVHVIVPVKSQGRWVQHFINNMEKVYLETSDELLNVIIVDFNSEDIDIKRSLENSKLKRYNFIKLDGAFQRALGLQAGADLVENEDDILFTCDLHLDIPAHLIDSIRKHTVKKKMGFAPIVHRLSCGYTPELPYGLWEIDGYGLFSISKYDFDRIGGMNTEEFKTKWGGEDWEFLDRALGHGLEVERLRIPKFFHHYHSKRKMWVAPPTKSPNNAMSTTPSVPT